MALFFWVWIKPFYAQNEADEKLKKRLQKVYQWSTVIKKKSCVYFFCVSDNWALKGKMNMLAFGGRVKI